MANLVFYFSGTGNSLKVAKALSQELGNAEIVSMAKPYNLTKQCETIGFVYPTYFGGLPKVVYEFVTRLNIEDNKNAYFYSIATCGGFTLNCLPQLDELLKKHGVKLNYGGKIKMFANDVLMYDMSTKIDKITKNSDKKLVPILRSIKNRETNKIKKSILYRDSYKDVSNFVRDYNVNENCISCGICREVCPMRNIEMANNKPQFGNNCEACLACIQYCPQKAINYRNATQNRRRYTNPEIDYKELAKWNSQ
jgi:formate hydrogenlyase subunit 6/NADH:ubiquinone oxidoreductase subunit I